MSKQLIAYDLEKMNSMVTNIDRGSFPGAQSIAQINFISDFVKFLTNEGRVIEVEDQQEANPEKTDSNNAYTTDNNSTVGD